MLRKGNILDNKYEIIKVLGMGGMGTVYLCKNTRLDNLWAIKEMKKDDEVDIDIKAEPNILKKLNYPGIPKIIDIFYENDDFYMVEEYIEGQTLKEYVEGKTYLEAEDICNIISSICDIIGYLHGFDPPIIYRDLKPSNIIITPMGKVVLIDFGISKIYKAKNNGDTMNLGSNGFAAPEQFGLAQCCKQTDIYGIGMVMYFMTTGKASLTAEEPLINENYGNNTNKDLKQVIQKCVQSEIKDRYTSTQELKDGILELLNRSNDDNTVVLGKLVAKVDIKTTLLSNSNIKENKKTRKFKLGLSLIGMIVVVALILVMGNFLYYDNKPLNSSKGTNKTTVNNTVPSIKSNTTIVPKAVKQPVQPVVVQPVAKQPSATPSNNNNNNSIGVIQSQIKRRLAREKDKFRIRR